MALQNTEEEATQEESDVALRCTYGTLAQYSNTNARTVCKEETRLCLNPVVMDPADPPGSG